jgi:hypothetical protein
MATGKENWGNVTNVVDQTEGESLQNIAGV